MSGGVGGMTMSDSDFGINKQAQNFNADAVSFHKSTAEDQALKTTDLGDGGGTSSGGGNTSGYDKYGRRLQPSFEHGDKEGMEFYNGTMNPLGGMGMGMGGGMGGANLQGGGTGQYGGANGGGGMAGMSMYGANGRYLSEFARRNQYQAYTEKAESYMEAERDYIEAERKAEWRANPYDPTTDPYVMGNMGGASSSPGGDGYSAPNDPTSASRVGRGGRDDYGRPSIYRVAANNPTGRALLQCVNEVEREKQLEYERYYQSRHHMIGGIGGLNSASESVEDRLQRSKANDAMRGNRAGGMGMSGGVSGPGMGVSGPGMGMSMLAAQGGMYSESGLFTPQALAERYKEEKKRRGEEYVTRHVNYEYHTAELLRGDVHIAACDPHLERAFRGHEDAVTSVAFTENGQVISGSLDSTVTVWPMRSTDHAVRFKGHLGAVNSVATAPGGKLVASGSSDHTVRLWLIDELWAQQQPGQSAVFKAHSSSVNSVDFSASGKSLLTASDDGEIKVWTIPGQKLRQTMTAHSGEVRCAKFSADSKRVASAGAGLDQTVRIFDLGRNTCTGTFHHHTGDVNTVSWLSHSMLMSGSDDRTLKLWDLRCGKLVLQFNDAHNGPVTDVSFHPGGQHVISTSTDSVVKVWDLRAADLYYKLSAHEGTSTAVAFNDEGNFFATGGSDEQVILWKTNFDRAQKPVHHKPVVPAAPFEDGVGASVDGFNLNVNCPSKGPVQYRQFGEIDPSGGLDSTRPGSPGPGSPRSRGADSQNQSSLMQTRRLDANGQLLPMGNYPTENRFPRDSIGGGHRRRRKDDNKDGDEEKEGEEEGDAEHPDDKNERDNQKGDRNRQYMWGLQRNYQQSKRYGGYGLEAEDLSAQQGNYGSSTSTQVF